MSAWGDDPELLEVFRGEVDDRLAALQQGLLHLVDGGRGTLAQLFRDAHTVKGSARMLGLADVVALTHRMEDLLGLLRDGRRAATETDADVLLLACGAVGALVAGGPAPEDDVLARLDAQLGTGPGVVPAVAPAAAARPTVVAAPRADLHDDPRLARLSAVWEQTVLTVQSPALNGPARSELDSARVGRATPEPTADVVPEPALPAAAPRHRPAPGRTAVRVGTERIGALLDAVASADQASRALAARLLDAREVLRALPAPDASVLALLDRLDAGLDLVAGSARAHEALHEGAVALATVPVQHVLAGLEVLARTTATSLGRQVRLTTSGGDVQLDARVLDAVSEAIGHLVTNAVDHGGRDGGAVHVGVRSAGDRVVVEVTDDGPGLDLAAIAATARARGLAVPADPTELLFAPGCSTRDDVSETSGRGVGLDAVRTAVTAVGGRVTLAAGARGGCTATVQLPVALGVLHVLVVRVGGRTVAVDLAQVAGTTVMAAGDDDVEPLAGLLGLPPGEPRFALLVGDRRLGVDAVTAAAPTVVRGLGSFLGSRPGGVRGWLGTTVDPDGAVVPVLDLLALPAAPAPVVVPAVEPLRPARILLAEDSVGVRELQRAVLVRAGYEVHVCVDGCAASDVLAGAPFDLVLTDVEMPCLDGLALCRRVRSTPGWGHVPVVGSNYLEADDHVEAGRAAGADAYLPKSTFDAAHLVATVRRLVGR